MPQEWIAPPDADTADGSLLDSGDEYHGDEHSMMLHNSEDRRENRNRFDEESFVGEGENQYPSGHPRNGQRSIEDDAVAGVSGTGGAPLRDTSGRLMPTSETAPTSGIR